jgi:outer membrane receptor protein involved in Fe transport
VPGAESLIEQDGLPEWRASGLITWRWGDWGAGYFGSYVGGVDDTGARLGSGEAWRIKPWLTHNLYLQYTLDDIGLADQVRLRLGARNITDEDPPLADTDTGYLGDLHSPRGRTVYFSIQSRF